MRFFVHKWVDRYVIDVLMLMMLIIMLVIMILMMMRRLRLIMLLTIPTYMYIDQIGYVNSDGAMRKLMLIL